MSRFRRCVLLALGLPLLAAAGEAVPEPPFVGEVTGTHVYIRAGDGINYTVLAVAENGQRVNVKQRRFGWLGIAVPENSTVWVHKTLVTPDAGGKEGTTAKDRVNVRARANPTADVLGQLPKGARVRVVDQDGDWYGIAAPPQVCAWIDARYVRKVGEAAATEPAKGEQPPQKQEAGREPAQAVKKTADASATWALLRKAQELYAAELAKPAKERNFNDVLAMYQKVATECRDEAVALQAEQARQRLLKIVDIHQALQAAREPLDQFERKYSALEAEYKKRAEGEPEKKPEGESTSEGEKKPNAEKKPEPAKKAEGEKKPE